MLVNLCHEIVFWPGELSLVLNRNDEKQLNSGNVFFLNWMMHIFANALDYIGEFINRTRLQ